MAPRSKKRKTAANPVVGADTTTTEAPKTTFLDLPVEIRCQIYGYLLEEEEPIKLRIQVHRRQNGPRELVRTYHSRDPKHHGKVFDKQSKKWVPRPFTHSAILLANRQINEEATPTLFASNRFSLECTTAVKDFLELIGKRGRHIRHVMVEAGGYKTSTVRGALKALTVARGLRALEFDHSLLCSRTQTKLTPPKLAEDCKTLMKSLRASHKALNLSGSVRDVLRIGLVPCLTCTWGRPEAHGRRMQTQRYLIDSCGCNCKDAEEKNAALQDQVRAAASVYLGQ